MHPKGFTFKCPENYTIQTLWKVEIVKFQFPNANINLQFKLPKNMEADINQKSFLSWNMKEKYIYKQSCYKEKS